MSSESETIKKLQNNRSAILFIELAGLLHDIGKLSKDFLEYRRKWHDDPNGYDNDPHDHDFLNNDTSLKSLIPSVFKDTIPNDILGEKDFSIERAVHRHVNPTELMNITRMLKAADGIDAAIDRNNPLFSAEQKIDIYRSNVFGHEKDRCVDILEQEKLRKELYQFLAQHLPDYFDRYKPKDRRDLLETIKEKFELGLSDTTRPQNDTTLWEHSYAVASILKCLTVHNLFSAPENSICDFQDVRFALLGVGWDGLRFMTAGQKIGDIVGRKKIIDDIKNSIKQLIEYKYPVGNEVYSDDNGIYFIVPAELHCGQLAEVGDILEVGINKAAAELSEGELQPYVEIHSPKVKGKKGIKTLTALVYLIQKLGKKRKYIFDSSLKGFSDFAQILRKNIINKKTVCPVCRFRPSQSEKKKTCTICEKRRRNAGESIARQETGTTVFIDEIKDKNNQAAVIVARFGLNEWLNGRLIRSLFVTEANGIEKEISYLGNVVQFKKEEKQIKDWFEAHDGSKYNYERIKKDIDSLLNKVTDPDRSKHTRFLYDRRILYKGGKPTLFGDLSKEAWQRLIEDANAEHPGITLYNILTAKNPTPSTILDVWDSTKEYFIDAEKYIIRSLLPEANRLSLTVKESVQPFNGALEAEIDNAGKTGEILYVAPNEIEIVGEAYSDKSSGAWQNSKIKIIDDGVNSGLTLTVQKSGVGRIFQPFRTITVSPNLFLVIVPADRALEITHYMYEMYTTRFGKVMGRLPFSIGDIFFKRDMPMFVVLDTAKRMIANFDVLAGTDKIKTFKVKKESAALSSRRSIDIEGKLGTLERSLSWKVPAKLGDGEDDFYHPYFIVEDNTPDRENFFETYPGNVVHFSKIKENDRLKLYLNYYDFEFLDSNARRYDVTADSSDRRLSNVGHFHSKPYLLDELGQKIIPLWKGLLQGGGLVGISDTKLRNLQSLWLTKYQEWQVNLGDKSTDNYQQWIELILSSLNKEFPHILSEQKELIEETVKNGTFFDALELYLGVMKERIDQQ